MYPLRLVHDLRPVCHLFLANKYRARFVVREAQGHNDERILAAVLDVFYRRAEALWSLYAVGERKGSLTIWAQTIPVADQLAWQAASAGPAIQDAWPVTTINAYTETMRTGGSRTIAMMADGHIVRKFPPEHDELNWLINLFDLRPSGPRRAW